MRREKSIDLTFQPKGRTAMLRLTARVEPERISKTPFQFPSSNLFKEIDESSQFYTYTIIPPDPKRVEGLSDSSGNPFFKEYCRTGSGHPAGFTSGWVSNDDQNLYVRMDFTPDNTMDGDKDYAHVHVKTSHGLKSYKVSEAEKTWGSPDFVYTAEAKYQHKIYEFSIPLSELGSEQGPKRENSNLRSPRMELPLPSATGRSFQPGPITPSP